MTATTIIDTLQEERKTPDAWLATAEFAHIMISDPDGWDRSAPDWAAEWGRPLTHAEFRMRLSRSSVEPRSAPSRPRLTPAQNAPKPTIICTDAPLQVATHPLPGDLHLTVYAAPDAPLGIIDVQLAAGKGCRGRGQRALDDARVYVAALRRMADHLWFYATEYEQAAWEDRA